MTALAEALLAAQRQAIGAMGKAYVAGRLEDDQLAEHFDSIGVHDHVDRFHLIEAWNTLKALGAEAPRATEPPRKEHEPASEAQWKLIRKLAEERGTVSPDTTLSKSQASTVIEQLKSGTYVADEWAVPF